MSAHATPPLRSSFLHRAVICGAIVSAWFGADAVAQGRAHFMDKVTILTAEGREIPKAGVSWERGKITGVGPRAKGGMLSKKIDGAGKYVTPGLIDLWSVAPLSGAPRGGMAAGQAADLFDLYDADTMRRHWQYGVVAAYLPATSESGVAGQGAVVKFAPPGGEESPVISTTASLAFVVGARDESPIVRVQQAQAIRAALREAQDYRDAKEDYETELKEYEDKLAEAAKKRGSDPAASAPAPSKPKAEPKPEAPKAEAQPDNRPPERRPERRRRRPDPSSASETASADEYVEDAATADAPPPGEKPTGDKPAGEDAKKPDGPKKPTEPPRDPSKDVLIRALNGEVSVRVWVERPEDILSVLAIGREFGLNLILEGASGAGRVVKQVREAEATVILGPSAADMRFDAGVRRFADPATAKKLEEAGVRVFLGSGPSEAGADLALMAAAAIGSGWDPAVAWKRITGQAVELLGASKRIGSLEMGDPADFVVWSGHPMGPGSRVERVFIDGIEVFQASEREGDR